MFNKILCPVDLKPRSKMGLRKALNIAHQFNSKVILLNVNEEFSSKKKMIMSRVSVSKLSEEFKQIAIKAKDDMKALVKELESNQIECEYLLRDGQASVVINKLINELNIDLVVMGTNGRDSLTDIIIGTTAQKVIQSSSCPILVVPKG